MRVQKSAQHTQIALLHCLCAFYALFLLQYSIFIKYRSVRIFPPFRFLCVLQWKCAIGEKADKNYWKIKFDTAETVVPRVQVIMGIICIIKMCILSRLLSIHGYCLYCAHVCTTQVSFLPLTMYFAFRFDSDFFALDSYFECFAYRLWQEGCFWNALHICASCIFRLSKLYGCWDVYLCYSIISISVFASGKSPCLWFAAHFNVSHIDWFRNLHLFWIQHRLKSRPPIVCGTSSAWALCIQINSFLQFFM